jgi:hypothetical protein
MLLWLIVEGSVSRHYNFALIRGDPVIVKMEAMRWVHGDGSDVLAVVRLRGRRRLPRRPVTVPQLMPHCITAMRRIEGDM